MNKNVLLVLVIMLTPIIVMGAVAVTGVQNIDLNEDEHEGEETNGTEELGDAYAAYGSLSAVPTPVLYQQASG